MRYGERLKLARELSGLTQEALADLVGMKQPSIAHLENKNATGSEFTPRLARVLRISVDWLADEIGDMIPTTYTSSDPKIIAVAKVMQSQPEYVKDAVVKTALDNCELAERAKANGHAG